MSSKHRNPKLFYGAIFASAIFIAVGAILTERRDKQAGEQAESLTSFFAGRSNLTQIEYERLSTVSRAIRKQQGTIDPNQLQSLISLAKRHEQCLEEEEAILTAILIQLGSVKQFPPQESRVLSGFIDHQLELQHSPAMQLLLCQIGLRVDANRVPRTLTLLSQDPNTQVSCEAKALRISMSLGKS